MACFAEATRLTWHRLLSVKLRTACAMLSFYEYKIFFHNCSFLPGIKPACFPQATRLTWQRLFSVKFELRVES